MLSLTNILLLSLSSFYVFNVHDVSGFEVFLFARLGSFQIVIRYLVSNELWRSRHSVFKTGKFVLGVERIRGLASGLELDEVGLGFLNICVGEIVFRLLQIFSALE